MPTIFKILWICSVGAIGLRSISKFVDEDFEAGLTYVAIGLLIILSTFQNNA